VSLINVVLLFVAFYFITIAETWKTPVQTSAKSSKRNDESLARSLAALWRLRFPRDLL